MDLINNIIDVDNPVEFIFYDKQEDQTKIVKVPDKAWEKAQDVFKDQPKISSYVIYKYLVRDQRTETENYEI